MYRRIPRNVATPSGVTSRQMPCAHSWTVTWSRFIARPQSVQLRCLCRRSNATEARLPHHSIGRTQPQSGPNSVYRPQGTCRWRWCRLANVGTPSSRRRQDGCSLGPPHHVPLAALGKLRRVEISPEPHRLASDAKTRPPSAHVVRPSSFRASLENQQPTLAHAFSSKTFRV